MPSHLRTVPEHSPAKAATPEAKLGFHAADQVAIAAMPGFVRADAEVAMAELATGLANEGGRGPSAQRALARDIAISRARLRYLQGLQTIAINRAADDPKALEHALGFERLIAGEHDRLLAALDALQRTEPPAPTSVRISADRAAVVVTR